MTHILGQILYEAFGCYVRFVLLSLRVGSLERSAQRRKETPHFHVCLLAHCTNLLIQGYLFISA